MPSNAVNIEHFDRIANDPKSWEMRAQDLLTSVEVLRGAANTGFRAAYPEDGTFNMEGARDALKYTGLLIQAAMLQGFAIECLLKRFWILAGNQVSDEGCYKIETIKRENHDLAQIADAVGFAITDNERDSLIKLSWFARSLGRYPISKKWQDLPLRKQFNGVGGQIAWDDENQQQADALTSRLRSSNPIQNE